MLKRSLSTLFYDKTEKRDIMTKSCFFLPIFIFIFNVCLSTHKKTVGYQNNMYLFLFHFILYTSFFFSSWRPTQRVKSLEYYIYVYLLRKKKWGFCVSDILFKHVEILLSGNKNISLFHLPRARVRLIIYCVISVLYW